MKMRHVVLDACVLFPEWLRDLFLRCAETGLFVFRWTPTILDEVQRNLERDRGLTAEKTTRLMNTLRKAFPDGQVENFEQFIAGATNHPKDRHVTAAGMRVAEEEGGALIVTANLRDFKEPPLGVEVSSPDDFLLELLAAEPAMLVELIWSHAQRRKRPPVAVEELLSGLATQAPQFAAKVSPFAHVRTDEQLVSIVARLTQAKEDLARVGPADSRVQEFLVALRDCSFAVPEFAERMKSLAKQDEQTIAEATLAGLREPATQAAFRALLSERGIELAPGRLASLTAGELLLLLERGTHRTQ